MDLTIRDARPEDADAIAGLLTQLGYPSEAETVEGRLDRLQVVGDRIVVAELDERVVGLAHLQVSPAIERDRPAAKLGCSAAPVPRAADATKRSFMTPIRDAIVVAQLQ